MVANALMCNWFVQHRGRAFGLANIGTSLSGATIPFLALVCISLWGTSAAYALLGGTAMLLAPLCHVLVRDTPAELGLHPDGERQAPPRQQSGPKEDCSIRSMLHKPEAYYLGLAFGLGLMCASGVMSQLKPRFTELGLSSYHAMILSCLSALFCGLSKYVWGWLCDRTNPLLVSRALLLSNIVMLAVSLLPHNTVSLVISSILLGACAGGYWTVLPAIVSYYFGAESFLAAYRFVSFFIILKSVAYPILGLSYDLTGSYNSGYVVYIVLVSLGFALTLLVKGEKAHDRLLLAQEA
jgi:sugar phosphate permease